MNESFSTEVEFTRAPARGRQNVDGIFVAQYSHHKCFKMCANCLKVYGQVFIFAVFIKLNIVTEFFKDTNGKADRRTCFVQYRRHEIN